LANTKRSASSGTRFTSGMRPSRRSDAIPSRPPPTGPMISTPIPSSCARATASSLARSSRLYCSVTASNSPVFASFLSASALSWKLKQMRFQKGCVATSATYTVLPGGRAVEVLNRCRSGSLDGPVRSIKGKARVVDEETSARLKVTFFWPFSGDYWIIDLGPEYEYAVVATPDRKYLWILSRTPRMDEEIYGRILERVRAQHFDPSRLERTPQPGA